MVPPPEYWPTLRAFCDKYGILLIADEVINGFGRTGKWFGIEHFDVVPDIITVAKGLSSGYLPISAVMARREVADAFSGDHERAFGGGITFGTHPVSCTVALANIEIIEREGLVDNARVQGASSVTSYAVSRNFILRWATSADSGCSKPWSLWFGEEAGLGAKMTDALKQRGLLSPAGSTIALAPPLCIARAEIDEMVAIVDDAIGDDEKQLDLSWRSVGAMVYASSDMRGPNQLSVVSTTGSRRQPCRS